MILERETPPRRVNSFVSPDIDWRDAHSSLLKNSITSRPELIFGFLATAPPGDFQPAPSGGSPFTA